MTVDLLMIGANGQVGWELARRSEAAGFSARACTRADLDLTQHEHINKIVGAVRPKIIVNAAAYTAVDKAESDQDAAYAINRDAPLYLAKAASRHGATLIHLSTDYVFDGAKTSAYVETDPVAPLGVYGASKLAGEDAVRSAGPKHVILRTAWVFGLHGHNFVKTMIRLAKERPALRVVDDQRGCPTFAGDLADAVLGVARQLISSPDAQDRYGTFHCVGTGETTWCRFARSIVAEAAGTIGKNPQVEAITTAEFPTPARRPANSVLACSKLARVYGLKLRPWQSGLTEMLNAHLRAQA